MDTVSWSRLATPENAPTSQNCDRQDAMAQYLSGDEGWLEARKALRGTFAKAAPVATGLTRDQDK